MNTQKLDNKKALDFLLAGNSIFTVLNTVSQNRFTFKVKKHKQENVHFVSVLSGPDVYSYLGFIKHGNFIYSTKSSVSKDSQSVKVFSYIFSKLKIQSLPDFIEFWHEGKCGKCGRTLTVPESIESGFGPECLKRVKK